MTLRSAKARTAARHTYLVLYALVIVMATWAWLAPPAPVEAWAGRFAVTVWTVIVVVGAAVGFVSAWAGWIFVERAASALLASGLALYAIAVTIFDSGDGVRAMQIAVSILGVAVFFPIRWLLHPQGYHIEPRPERLSKERT